MDETDSSIDGAGRAIGNGEVQPEGGKDIADALDRDADLTQHTARTGEPSGTARHGDRSELDDPDVTADDRGD